MLPNIPKVQYIEEVNGRNITFQPFEIGHEKNLLMIKDEDPVVVSNGILQILDSCLVGSDSTDLSPVEIEYMFIKIYSRSVDNIIPLTYTCKNGGESESSQCNTSLKHDLNLKEVGMITPEGFTDIFTITEEPIFGIKLKSLSYKDVFGGITNIDNRYQLDSELLLKTIDQIIHGDQIIDFNAADHTDDQKKAFIKSIPMKTKLKMVQDFFGKLPQISYKFELVCPKCEFKHKFSIGSLREIFG